MCTLFHKRKHSTCSYIIHDKVSADKKIEHLQKYRNPCSQLCLIYFLLSRILDILYNLYLDLLDHVCVSTLMYKHFFILMNYKQLVASDRQ